MEFKEQIANDLNLTIKQVEVFEEIYFFIARFATLVNHFRYKKYFLYFLQDGTTEIKVPPKTLEIVENLKEDLAKYYSPHAYRKYFKSFCKKLKDTGKVVRSDYIAKGVIATKDIEVVESKG